MTDRDNTRSLAHVGDDEAFAKRLKHAVYRLHRRYGIARPLEAVQHLAMPVLLGATDTATGQVTHTDQRTDNGAKEGGSIGFSISWPERAGNTRAGEKQDAGCAAAGGQA